MFGRPLSMPDMQSWHGGKSPYRVEKGNKISSLTLTHTLCCLLVLFLTPHPYTTLAHFTHNGGKLQTKFIERSIIIRLFAFALGKPGIDHAADEVVGGALVNDILQHNVVQLQRGAFLVVQIAVPRGR